MENVETPYPIERRLRWTWIVAGPRYSLVFLREITSVFFMIHIVLLAILLHKAGQSAETHQNYLDFLWNPGMVVLHFVTAGAALWHTFTWFTLTPKAIVLRVKGWQVPAFALVVPQIGAWAVITGLVISWIWWVGAL